MRVIKPKKRKRVSINLPKPGSTAKHRLARISLAAACFCFENVKDGTGEEKVENAASAMAVLALLGLVKPGVRKPRQPRRRAPKSSSHGRPSSGAGRGKTLSNRQLSRSEVSHVEIHLQPYCYPFFPFYLSPLCFKPLIILLAPQSTPLHRRLC